MTLKHSTLFLSLALLISGCAHYPRNARLTSNAPATAYRFSHPASPTNSSDLLLMLAFSGGGTRAAALSYGVLEELARTPVTTQGEISPSTGSRCEHQDQGAPPLPACGHPLLHSEWRRGMGRGGAPVQVEPHRLLDEVDIISSVSGGSFTAAYYALWGDRIFSDFESKFLKKNVQTGLILRVLSPWNQVRMVSPKFSRSDVAAEYYDHLLFKGATFADLMSQSSRPFLSINATDVGSGARFEFTQDEFDLIHSDLSRYPISRAVAASAAYPVLLSPVILKNYSGEQSGSEPEWIKSILGDPTASARMRYMAAQARSYGDGHRKFIHLA